MNTFAENVAEEIVENIATEVRPSMLRVWCADIWHSITTLSGAAPRALGLIYRECGLPIMLGYSVAVIFLTLGPLLLSYFLGALVDGLVSKQEGAYIEVLPLLVLALVILIPGISRLQSYLNERLKNFLWFKLVVSGSEAMGTLDVTHHQNQSLQDMLTRVREKAQWRMSQFADNQLLLLLNLVGVVIAWGMLQEAGWWPLLVLVATLPELIVELSYGRSDWKVDLSQGESWRSFWFIRWYLIETAPLTELKVFGLTKHFAKRLEGYAERNRRELDRNNHRFLWWRLVTLMLSHAIICLAAYQLIGEARRGELQPGELTFLVGALISLAGALSRFAVNLHELCKDCHLVTEYFTVSDMAVRRDADGVAARPRKAISFREAPLIEFEHVSFTYPGAKNPVISDLSLRFEPGKKYCFLGSSGAGKTTLANLICGLIHPTAGRILVDGHDLRELDQDAWLSRLGVLPQNFEEFKPFTIRDVILFGTPGDASASDDQLLAAAQAAQAATIIRKQAKGLDQLLGKEFENGAWLSRGEWQRVRLASVFHKNAPVNLLDEPTSALDAENEMRIMEQLFARNGKTLLLITHRLSNCRDAERIFFLKKGKIREEGSHDELIAANGIYARFFRHQRRGYR